MSWKQLYKHFGYISERPLWHRQWEARAYAGAKLTLARPRGVAQSLRRPAARRRLERAPSQPRPAVGMNGAGSAVFKFAKGENEGSKRVSGWGIVRAKAERLI